MSSVNGINPYTPRDWERLAQEKRHPDLESQQATHRGAQREMDRQYQRLDELNVRQGEKLVDRMAALRMEIDETADGLRHIGDWGERSGVSLEEWAALDARVGALKSEFGRLLGGALTLLNKLEDPVAHVEEFYQRFPQLRPAVPTYLL